MESFLHLIIIKLAATTNNTFTFYLAGHSYGAQYYGNIFPAASLLSSIDQINNDPHSKLLILLGDIVYHANSQNFTIFNNSVSNKLKLPIFNAIGNHDTSDEYIKRYGNSTYYSFDIKTNRFIFLDTEINNGNIIDDQLLFLTNAIKRTDKIKNIFILSHKLIWLHGSPHFKKLLNHSNGKVHKTNFKSTILPLLEPLRSQNIYWISGDVGLKHSCSIFFEKHNNITYIATGLGGIKTDAILKATVTGTSVTFDTISTSAQQLPSIETFNSTFWINHFKNQDFQKKLNKIFKLHIFKHRYFWYGIIFCIFISRLPKLIKHIIYIVKRQPN